MIMPNPSADTKKPSGDEVASLGKLENIENRGFPERKKTTK